MSNNKYLAIFKISHVLTIVAAVIISIFAVISIVFSGYILITDEAQITNLGNKFLEGTPLYIDSFRFSLDLQNYPIENLEKKKLLLPITIYFVFLMLNFIILINAMRLIKSFINQMIFTDENVKRLDRIAVITLVISFIFNPLKNMARNSFVSIFPIDKMIANNAVIYEMEINLLSINLQLLLFGLIIWIISQAFRYGMFLKEEYDATV